MIHRSPYRGIWRQKLASFSECAFAFQFGGPSTRNVQDKTRVSRGAIHLSQGHSLAKHLALWLARHLEMSDKPKSNDRKRKYRSDGSPLWSKQVIEGPGVWASCIKGKEKQAVGELYDLFESLASEIWTVDIEDASVENTTMSIEAQVANELAAIKRPRRERKFTNCQTNTPCVVFISCKPPVDPVKLVLRLVNNVETTGVLRTRYTQRLVPVSDTCSANIPEIRNLCSRIISPFFTQDPEKRYTYKIELRMRNHTTLSRQNLIEEIAHCVPEGHQVNLDNPMIFILVEVFKNVCGVSLVEDYYRHQKFNVMEIANALNKEANIYDVRGRVQDRVTVATGP